MRFVLVLAAFLFATPFSLACSCGGPNPICSAYWQTPVVFRGKVAEQVLVSSPETTVKNLDGSISTLRAGGFYRVRFSVFEAFRGEPQKEIIILTNEQSSACGFPFETGGEYLVFGFTSQTSDELWTSKCTLTHKLEVGKEDPDLTWMRALPSAPAGAIIFGNLTLPRDDFETARPTATISLRGQVLRDATTDRGGHYSFSALPPGDYTISAVMPPGFATLDARKVVVKDRGCAQVDWAVLYDSHVRGRVTDASGRALNNIYMVLERRDPRIATGLAMVGSSQTDSDGHYDFSLVPPGDYLVSANHLGPSPMRPYPRVYYPNADSDVGATSIHLAASSVVENIDITLPNAWKAVTVHTRVLQPDGSPATGADVNARDIDYSWSGEPATATAGANGDATLTVYEGRTYYLTATISGGTQQRCAGPLKFTAKDEVRLDAITIEHNWGNCLAQLSPNFRPPR